MKDQEQIIAQVRKRYALAREGLDERGRRHQVAAEALALGWGGVRLVAEATGVARATITLGLKERRGQIAPPPAGRSRRPGGGRKALAGRTRRRWWSWSVWWSRPPGGIRSRRCAGRARACASWRQS